MDETQEQVKPMANLSRLVLPSNTAPAFHMS